MTDKVALPESYSSERVFLLPFCPSQPPFNSADGELQDLLSYLYKRTKEDGLLEILFTGMEPPSKDRFIYMLYTKPLIVGFLKPHNGEVPQAIGFGWLMELEGEPGRRKANFGFSFFRQYWGSADVREATWMTLRWWFEEMGCDVLFGPTLKRNLLAQRFAQEMGFRKIAEIPMFFSGTNGLENCVLVSMTKDEFHQIQERREIETENLVQIRTDVTAATGD